MLDTASSRSNCVKRFTLQIFDIDPPKSARYLTHCSFSFAQNILAQYMAFGHNACLYLVGSRCGAIED